MVDVEDLVYTGIGARKAPEEALRLARHIGYLMAKKGYTLRSGRAAGMDEAFEVGAIDYEIETGECRREIWLPWNNFRDKETTNSGFGFTQDDVTVMRCGSVLEKAGVIDSFKALTAGVQRLFARNVYQVLGEYFKDGGPVPWTRVVIYWSEVTANGDCKGGTRIAVNLAKAMGIATYNLNIENERITVMRRLGIGLDYFYG